MKKYILIKRLTTLLVKIANLVFVKSEFLMDRVADSAVYT